MLATPQRPQILTILSTEQLWEKRESWTSALQECQSFWALCLKTTTYHCKLSGGKYLKKRLIWPEISWSVASILFTYSTCLPRRGSGTFISSWENLMSAPFSRSSMRPFLSQAWTPKPPHTIAPSASCVAATKNAHILGDASSPFPEHIASCSPQRPASALTSAVCISGGGGLSEYFNREPGGSHNHLYLEHLRPRILPSGCSFLLTSFTFWKKSSSWQITKLNLLWLLSGVQAIDISAGSFSPSPDFSPGLESVVLLKL